MITRETTQHIANLARINLSEEEQTKLTRNLEDILTYISKLERLDITAIEPTSHVLPLKNVFREDVVAASLPQQDALSTAITQQDGAFTVPQVVE